MIGTPEEHYQCNSCFQQLFSSKVKVQLGISHEKQHIFFLNSMLPRAQTLDYWHVIF